MKIRTRVKIAGVVAVCVLLAYGAVVLHLDRAMSNLAREIKETNEIVNKISILRNLTQDYLLYRTERARRQWSALYEEVFSLLESPDFRVLKREYGLGDAPQKLKIVGATFSRLMTVQQNAGADNPGEGAGEELKSRLATQLLLATQDLLTRFFNLTEEVNQKLIRTQRLMSLLDILALLSLGLIIISAGVFLQRSVVKPVLKLHEGAEIIGAGNLDYKVGLNTRDEVGELTRAFDRMTANLKEITVSRDDLAAEIEERKRAEEALRESEEHYRSLFEHMLDGFAYCRMHFEQNRPVDFTYLKVNDAFETLTGLKNVIGKKVSEVIPGIREANPELFEIYGRVALTGKPERFENYLDPLKMWLSVSVYSPQKEYFVAVFDVITARKQAEEALRESEARFRSLFENMTEAVALHEIIYNDQGVAVDYRILATNPAFSNHTGLQPEQIQGKPASQVYGTGDAPFLEVYARVAHQGEPTVFETFFPPLQRHFTISATSPKRGHFVTVFEDITERKQAEKETQRLLNVIQQEKEKLTALVNSISDEVWFADTQKKFTLANPSALGEFKLNSNAEIDVEKFAESLEVYRADGSPRAIEETPPLRALQGEIVRNIEEIVRTPATGELRHRQISASPVRDSNNNIIGSVSVVRDITARKQAEEKLQATLLDLERSNRDLEEFAFISSHDLQEPLRKIANFSEMLGEQYRDRLDADGDRYLGYIADGAKRMQALITDLLAYSRVGRADLTMLPASLEDVLQGTLSDLQPMIKESNAQITHDPLPTLKVNPSQISQLLQNLITNAIKFRGGQPPRINLSAKQDGARWVFALRDNGMGFDSQYAGRIFKVFQSLHARDKYPGTGIGLAICKKIVGQHGGCIWAESQPGLGSTFYFTIPV